MGDSTIEWTDKTWNPLAGCEYASEGCRGCYAARDAAGRLSSHPIYAGLTVRAEGELPRFTGEVRALPDRLDQPMHWRRPCKVFVNSMSDLFHPAVLDMVHVDRLDIERPFLAEVFATMVRASHHQFQILTKRPQIMRLVTARPQFRLDVNAILVRDGHEVMPGGMTDPDFTWPAHLWMGSSIELNKYKFRADHVRATRAAVRFLSLEPLLGPLDDLDLTGIDWVIVGGESGPQARPMDPDWARDLRDRCNAAGVPFLFKQWGEWIPYELDPQPPFWVSQHGDMIDGHHLPAELSEGHPIDGWWAPPGSDSDTIHRRAGKKAAGRELDGRTWDEYPAL